MASFVFVCLLRPRSLRKSQVIWYGVIIIMILCVVVVAVIYAICMRQNKALREEQRT